jgi:hypothetical protein
VDEILTVPAQMRLSTNTLPVRTEATMAQVISEWEYSQQRIVLQQKLHQLALLRTTAPNQIAPLLERYWVCLHTYLVRRDHSNYSGDNKRQIHSPGPLLANEAVRQLATLDKQRLALRQQLTSHEAAMPRRSSE